MPSERQFQKWFLRFWQTEGQWGENIHPSFGMKTGVPDIFVLAGKIMVPIELKLFEMKKDKLVVTDIRPAQIRWAKKFAKHGGISGLVAGYHDGMKWHCAVIRNEAWLDHKKSFSDEDYVIVDTPFKAVMHVLSQ